MYRNNRFSFFVNEKEFCDRVINVTFEYSVKEFNRSGKDVYIQLGQVPSEIEWFDCVGYNEGQIVAIKTNQPVARPIRADMLPKYFLYADGKYFAKTNIKNAKTVSDIRKELYANGFWCNGTRYVRWKRSSGSARVGKCLFIDEKLYPRLHKWEMCGLNVRNGDAVDLAALESYISLTSSSILDVLPIEPKNILVIDDYDSIFTDDVINVTEENGELRAKSENTAIKNSIFDGQSLIDPSIMGIYASKGMVLLRNRFFKSCCFNANIQKWFNDNHITDVSQLNGFTLADTISDIKLITTPNSIKYVKFASLEQWFNNLETDFGVVKYEKPPHFLDGRLVQTHYQLINTLQLTREEMKDFLTPTFDFMKLIKNDPAVLRHWIKFRIEDEIQVTPVKSKTDVIYKMMSVNEDFCRTSLYYDFCSDFLKSFTKDLKCGHVLVNGNYSVLCGNPIEMLLHSIGRFDGNAVVQRGCVYSTRFEWNKTLLGSRSPHPSISNVLLTENRYDERIATYMNGTPEIVYVNSINENLLQQIAGADFDSDSVLLTDNHFLIEAAKKNDGRFKVAVCNVGGTKKKRKYCDSDKADLDIKTSRNLIGDIINLSQELNTAIWEAIYRKRPPDEIMDIYLDVCLLSVLSGIEIDKAKKEFLVNSAKELARIRDKHRKMTDEDKTIKPNFFAHISRQKGYYNPQKKEYKRHHTSMDYLQQCVNQFRYNKTGRAQKHDFILFSEVIDKGGFNYQNVHDKAIHKVLDDVDNLNQRISAIYGNENLKPDERHSEVAELRQEFIESVGRSTFNRDTMIALLQTIEKDENQRYKRLLFYTLFGYPNSSFYAVIKEAASPLPIIAENIGGNLQIFGVKYSKNIQKNG